MTYHDYNCECNDCDSSKWIDVGDIVKFELGATFYGGIKTKDARRRTWYGLVTKQGNDSCKVKWFDATYWMNANRWIHTSRLEKISG